MDIQSRKIEFIQQFLKVQNEDLILCLEKYCEKLMRLCRVMKLNQ